MAILRTDPNISIRQTTDGKLIQPTTNDPSPVVRINVKVENMSNQYPNNGKITLTCTNASPSICTIG